MGKKIVSALLTLVICHQQAFAQEYPYDDFVPELKKKKEYDNNHKIPVEKPRRAPPALENVFGLNLQAGGNFTVYQSTDDNNLTTTSSGPGYAVALGFGWDMQKHPISIEFETGFQQSLLGTSQKLGTVPLKFSTFYRSKLSDDAVIRFGGGSSLDLRMSSGEWSIVPSWHLSFIYEYASFTFEPALQIMRIRVGDSFLAGAFYLGYRI